MKAKAVKKDHPAEKIWKILEEVSEGRKATDRQVRETALAIKEMKRETKLKVKETDRMIKEMRQETARIIQETRDWVNKIEGQFGNQWGELVEALIEGSLLQLLNERGIKVDTLVPNYKAIFKKGKERVIKEFDLIAMNGKEMVVVETKSALNQKKTDQFLKAMAEFKEHCSDFHRGFKVYGGLAYLRCRDEGAVKHAAKKGLFVIKVSGKNASIMNSKRFKPKVFSASAN